MEEVERMEDEEEEGEEEEERMRSVEAIHIEALSDDQVILTLTKERISSAQTLLKQKHIQVEDVTAIIQAVCAEIKEIEAQTVRLDKLQTVLGNRGIQNYVFQGVLHQLQVEWVVMGWVGIGCV